MSTLRNLALCIAVVGFCAVASPAFSILGGTCQQICDYSTPCNETCLHNGQLSTCAVFRGKPANDFDNDGVPNSSDNCICTANSNQADCDFDGIGNVCDSYSVKWLNTGTGSNVCSAKIRLLGAFNEIAAFGSEIWRDNCSGATCVRNVLRGTQPCNLIETPASVCCNYLLNLLGASTSLCQSGSINKDFCGVPKCSF